MSNNPTDFTRERDEAANNYAQHIVDNWHSLGTYKSADFKAGANWALTSSLVKELVRQLEVHRDKLIQYAGPDVGLYETGDANQALERYNAVVKSLEDK